jgi:hypothetical protein
MPGKTKRQLNNIMNAKNRLLLGLASIAALVATTATADTNVFKTYRTTGYFVGLTQGTNAVTDRPIYENVSFAGHNLVNLAMGRSLTDTNFPNEVMAMTFACDLSSADLVVWDLTTSNVVALIAASVSVDAVYQQDPLTRVGPNHAHFVAALQINPVGGGTNGVLGGYFTVAGRLNLNPETGCPQPVLVALDRDTLDKTVDDMELPASLDPDSVPLLERTGLAHLIGVVDVVTWGNPHTILVPYGGLSIRRELPYEPLIVPPPTTGTSVP